MTNSYLCILVTKKIFFVWHFLQLTVKSCQFLRLTAIFEAVLRLSVYPIETPLIKKKKKKEKRKRKQKQQIWVVGQLEFILY